MSYDVAAYGFLGIGGEHGAAINLSHNLIGDHDGDSEFIGDSLEGAEELG